MTKSRYRYRDARGRDVDEAEALENGILRDGFAVSTGMYMMDATQRSIATHLHDGHGGGIGHRPGHIVSGASEALDARRRMYDEYDARKATEYLGADREGREGTICTVRNAQFPRAQGAPGRIRNGICVSDDEELRDALPTRDSTMTLDAIEARHRARMADEYAAYDVRIREM
jgi:hypothetical protein